MSASQSAGEIPQITSSVYGTTTTGLWPAALEPEAEASEKWAEPLYRSARSIIAKAQQPTRQEQEQTMPSTTRRLVQVFIADTDSNVPLESALLYKGEPQFTDSTDQELYFEIPVSALLGAHNEKRKGWLDKDATRKAGKDIFLEPAKIRDLKMVVVTIAQF